MPVVHFLTSFRSLLRRHLLGEAFPDHLSQISATPAPHPLSLYPALFCILAPTLPDTVFLCRLTICLFDLTVSLVKAETLSVLLTALPPVPGTGSGAQ